MMTGKVVIVSGVGPGLGTEAAHLLASHGAAVVCLARTASYVAEVVEAIRADGGEATAAPGDITSRADCERVALAVEQTYGRLDGLVNSAFTAGTIAPFADADLDNWRQVVGVNLFGTLNLIQTTLDLLRRDGGAAVVNVNTTSSVRPMLGQGAYGTSKAALEFATRQLAVELGPENVRVNTMYCGPMLGPSLDDAMGKWADRSQTPRAEIESMVASNMALKRIPEDAEAAEVLVALLSDHCRVLTGTAVHATAGAWLDQHI